MSGDLQAELGKRVRELRKLAGLTQSNLAERSGVSDEFISRVERGIKAPSLQTAARLADALGIGLPELFSFSQVQTVSDHHDRLRALMNLLAAEEPQVVAQAEAVLRALLASRQSG